MLFGNKDKEKKDRFKFRDLKIYASTQTLADNSKFYRMVFDASEINYLYFELSLFNKLFDEEDWNTKVEFKVYELISNNERKEICHFKSEKEISRDINIIYFREGWGTDRFGGFWKKGYYEVDAWVDGEKVGNHKFYIENAGVISETNNPYFKISSIRLYNAPGDGIPKEQRKYQKAFKQDETQYVWCELALQHLLDTDHNLEIFFNFYDKAGLFKASMTQYAHVKSGSINLITTYLNGWGNENKGNWHKGHYTLHIMSMGSILAVVPFEIGEVNLDGDPEIFYPANGTVTTGIFSKEKSNIQSSELSLEESLKELDQFIGLNNIKTEIHNQINYLNFLKLRREKGFEDQNQINLHSVFTGNPGTGKTTVVNQLGKIYKAMGLLSKGHVVEVDRADLVAEYIGQTAPKVKKQIEAARGGILFIDEAYALSRQGDDNKDYGKEVIEILLKEMSDGTGDIAIMVAGYPREMNVFLNSNPGLRSRFGQYYHFEDYLPEELMQIAMLTAHRKKLNLTDDAKIYLEKKLTDAYRSRDESFGNARFATSLIHEAKQNLAIRIMKHTSPQTLSEEEISTISLEDIEKIFLDEIQKKLDIEIDDELLRSALDELNRLIGLQNIKQEVQEYVKLVKYYREIGKDVLNQFSLHTVFTGNPGTGKTTVARIMAKLYKALGLLERGHLVEADRQSLIAGYVGQTANKTKQLIESAMGGVLFIDEAYALANKGNDDFGHEAIEILLKAMEDHRGKFAVIVAGYTDDMQEFLESNPGLKSRFDEIFEFPDYTVDELYAIAGRMLQNEHLVPDEEAASYLKNYLHFLYEHRDKYFGNAREVRKIIEKAVKNQHIRLASVQREERTPEMIKTLTLQDLEEFKMINPTGDKTKIGFRKP